MGILGRPELYICGVYLAIIVGVLWFLRSTVLAVARIIAHAIAHPQTPPTTPPTPGSSAPPSMPPAP